MSTVQIKGDQIKNATVEASKLDLSDDYTFTGDVQVPSTPANNSSAVAKSYVLDLVQGLSYKDPVRVSDQSAISATYDNAAGTLTANSNGEIDIDSISSPQVNDRILIRKFAAGARVGNGIYIITTVGDASNPFVLTRASDMNESDEFRNATVFVSEGTDADVLFTQQTDNPTLGTDFILFVQISGAAGITAGAGLTKSGNTLDVNVGAGLEIVSDEVRAKIGDGLEDDSGTTRIKLDGSSINRSSSGLAISSGGVQTIHIGAAAVTSAKINSAVAGNGLTGGAGTSLSVQAADGISSLASGVTINLDGSTLSKSSSGLKVNSIGTTEISNNAITEEKINSSVAGDGISGGAGTALAVDLATNAGLTFSSNKLDLLLESTSPALEKDANGLAVKLDGTTLAKSGSGLKVNSIGTTEIVNNAVTESKIASSVAGQGLSGGAGTALAVALKPSASGLEFVTDQLGIEADSSSGLNIDNTNGLQVKLQANGGLDFDVSSGGIEVEVDDASITISTGGELEIQNSGVTTAKIADNNITLSKIKFRPEFESFSGNGSATTFDLQFSILAAFQKAVQVFRNGLRLKYVASNPANVDEYTVANNGTGGVARVSLGAAPSSSDTIFVDYLYDVS